MRQSFYLGGFVGGLLLAGSCAGAALPFFDDFEGGLGNWSPGGSWGLTTAHYASPGHAATDSPGSFYTNNTDTALALAVSLDLTGATRPALAFQHQYALEAGYDFGYVEVSTNGGSAWLAPAVAAYTGNLGVMSREQLDLSAYAGVTALRLRFRLVTDSSVVMDGWYVDDVRVAEAPAPVTLRATQTNRNSVALAWDQAAAPGFGAYRLYRSLSPGVDWHTARLVAEVTGNSVTNATDIATSPKSRYYYRLAVVNTDGMLALGNEIGVTTPAGMDYPFVDNGEGGGGTWIPDAPWALSDEDAASPSHAWSDSPGANYTNSIPSQSLTLAAPVYLAGQARNPALCFNHKYDFVAGDSANVEVSTNSGADWSSLAVYTGTATNLWQRGRVSLIAYTNAAVLVRFRITTDTAGTADGWHVDDISVAESPDAMPAPILDNVTSHSIRISWAANTNAQFTCYMIFRSTAPGAGVNSTLVTTIPNQSVTTFTDSSLALDTVYYYRIYAVTAYGTLSADSALESTARTLNNPSPFGDGFEGGLANWNLTGSWGLTTNYAHSGTYSLTDSPQGNYANSSDSYALTAVNLAGTSWPVLRFWDRFRLASGDYACVEVSPDGSHWTRLYGVTGIRTDWGEQSIDLSAYRNESNLRIRLHQVTDGSATEDGWYVDDLTMSDLGTALMALPFCDGFENGLSNWQHSAWAVDPSAPFAGGYAVHDTPTGLMAPSTFLSLTLNGALDLTNHANAQLTFWVRGHLNYITYFRAQVSTDGGLNWADLSACNVDYGYNNDSTWVRKQASLSAYANQTIRVRLLSEEVGGNAPDSDIWVDNVTIEDVPTPVALVSVTPHLKTVDLNWTASTLGGAFKRYEVYRSTTAGVTFNSTLIGTFTDAGTTGMTDTGLSIGSTYYYAVTTVDSHDTYSASNERSTTTVPLTLPMSDAMESLDQWVVSGTWGIATNATHGGNGSLTDSPFGDYANSSDTYALTAVNLTGTRWPVLRFWDRFRLAGGDYACMEVSPDGSHWTRLYGAASVRTDWAEQSIDLSAYRNQTNLRIRLHLMTDGSATEDGWYVDDLAVSDLGQPLMALPFYDGFENGLSNWQHSAWAVDPNAPFAGGYAVHDTPMGLMPPSTFLSLTLNGALDLTNHANAQLTFWVRGHLNYITYFRAQVSTDGGLNWADLSACNVDYGYNNDSTWVRKQASLSAYANQTIRVRLLSEEVGGNAPDSDIWVDNVTIEDVPTPVALVSVTPHLKTVDLNWTTSTLGGAFKRYEVYRSTTAGVTFNSTLIGTFTDAATTGMTDAGLSIGSTYYYAVMTVDSHDTYSASNERSTTTVPLTLPVSDAMESLDQWVVTGTWGITTNGAHSGNGALTDSPFGDYANSSDTYALTAVNLAGTSWPVLRFWDRFRLASGDYAYAEVSPDGSHWTRLYGATSVRTDWAEQSIDLSAYRNQTNLRIRLHLVTDGSATEDGWYVDDLTVSDLGQPLLALPFYDGFENGLSNWQHSTWAVDPSAPFAGGYAVHDTPTGLMTPSTFLSLTLNRALDLTNHANAQLTFWVRGHLNYITYFRAQVSTDGGLNWAELSACNVDYGYSNDSTWVRKQASLSAYANQTIRVRLLSEEVGGNAPDSDIWVDNVTIEDVPAPVALVSVTPHLKTVDLNWTTSPLGGSFKRYEVYRATHANVTFNDTLIGTFTDAATTGMTDTGLSIGSTYYYAVMTVDSHDTYSASNERSATTVPLTLPVSDAMESLDQWVVTGTWGITTNGAHSGNGALTDSPFSDYANSSDTYALTAVNLTGSSWPVLRFWDRFRLASGDYAYVEVSPDGSHWTRLYGVTGIRTNWAEQSIDLSAYKNESNLRIRMRLITDGGATEDGWCVDDLAVSDLGAALMALPFYDGFENGLSNWQHSAWAVDPSAPFAGGYAVHDTPTGLMAPSTFLALTLNGALDLTNRANEQLTFWVRGHLNYITYFRAQVSTDGGLTWVELSACNVDYGYSNDSTWVRKQVSLSAYVNQTIRLRFLTEEVAGNAPDSDIWLDGIGIGEPPPGPPSLSAPAELSTVSVLRPTLVVNNAIDYQSDPLTYRYEVYTDAALSNLVAQVPVVASGANVTGWPVDVDLPNNAQYWWRCRASDGPNTGPWMPTASFFVNEVNHPPLPVTLAGPPAGTVMSNLDDVLFWYPTTDPDAGDAVVSYQVQVDDNGSFASPEVSVTNLVLTATPGEEDWAIAVALRELAGSSNLVAGGVYHWRVRAADTHGAYSAWPAGDQTFQFGIAPPRPAALSGLRRGPNGTMSLEWQGAAGELYVEFSLSLSAANWQTIAGPLRGTNWSFTPVPGAKSGFYRVRSE